MHAKISALGMQLIYNINVSNLCSSVHSAYLTGFFFCPQPFKSLSQFFSTKTEYHFDTIP